MSDISELQPIEVFSSAEALKLIDSGLSTFSGRQLVSAAEVTDLLLDLRAVLEDQKL